MIGSLVLVVALLLGAVGCGSDTPIGTVNGTIMPCNQARPSFDVWRAHFAPNDREVITARVDTRSEATAAEFRLVVACQGEIVAEEIGGSACTYTPPRRGTGRTPECAYIEIEIDDLDFDGGFIECFAEIGTTQSLGVGTGACADAEVAEYSFRMTMDFDALALDLVADDCRAEESCLESMFGLE